MGQFTFYSKKYKALTIIGEEGEIRGCYQSNSPEKLNLTRALFELEGE